MCGVEFYIDFGLLQSSTDDYKCPNKATDRIVTSYDGYSAHLVIMDGASQSQRVWVFFHKFKEPPFEILTAFMSKFALAKGPSGQTRAESWQKAALFVT
jgi:hypothetical protein